MSSLADISLVGVKFAGFLEEAFIFFRRRTIMPHPVGERLRCDDCGAEVLFVKACPCPEKQPRAHSDICCGKEMRNLGVDGSSGQG